MRINYNNQNFKGWDAAPLRRIYIEKTTAPNVLSEMKKMGANENIEIEIVRHPYIWMQDHQVILKRYAGPILLADKKIKKDSIEDFNKLEIPVEKSKAYVTGGNSFIGKNQDGQYWMLVGKDELCLKRRGTIKDKYNVEKENIFSLPQQDFHIDMAIRPIGYPYVLVNDFKLGEDFLDEIEDDTEEFKNFEKNFYHNWRIQDREYAPAKDMIKALKKAGFVPIPIAGVFGFNINFMNGIVNKHQDGTISYITNSSKCKNIYSSQAQKFFERSLREKMNNIKDVYFIQGCNGNTMHGLNYMMGTLENAHGGIHCLCLEEPDFDIWG